MNDYKALMSATLEAGRTQKPKDALMLAAQLGCAVQQDYRAVIGQHVPYSMVTFVDEFCEKTEFGRELFSLQRLDPGGFRELVHTVHKAACWAEQGYSVFELSHSLASAFMLTDPPPVPEGGLSLPFNCFCLRVPPGVVPMFLDGEQYWAQLIWVHMFRSVHVEHGEIDFLRVAVEHKGVKVWRDRFPADIANEKDETIFNRTFLGDPEYIPEDNLTPAAAVRVLRNFISWLHTQDPKTIKPVVRKRKKKGKKAKRLEESGAFPRVYLMGKGVTVHPAVKHMAAEVALGSSKKHRVEGWEVRVRHIVRGHWKQQAYGPERSLRKQIWVEPYWRGPEDADVWAHLYK